MSEGQRDLCYQWDMIMIYIYIYIYIYMILTDDSIEIEMK